MWFSIYMNYIVFLTAEGEEKWIVMKAESSNSEKPVKPPAFVFKCLSEWLADFWVTSVRLGSGPSHLSGNVSNTAAFSACLIPSSFIYPIIWRDRFISHSSWHHIASCFPLPVKQDLRNPRGHVWISSLSPARSTEHTAPAIINHALKWWVTEWKHFE